MPEKYVLVKWNRDRKDEGGKKETIEEEGEEEDGCEEPKWFRLVRGHRHDG